MECDVNERSAKRRNRVELPAPRLVVGSWASVSLITAPSREFIESSNLRLDSSRILTEKTPIIRLAMEAALVNTLQVLGL
jgi:hypothetical protein